jgi:hypothetical protein
MKIPMRPSIWSYDDQLEIITVTFHSIPNDMDDDPASYTPDQEYTLEIPAVLKWAVYTGTHSPTTEGAVEP